MLGSKLIKLLLFVSFVIALMPGESFAQNFRSGASFWTPPSSTSQCRSSYKGIGNYKLSKSLTRRPYPNDDGRNFAGHFGMWLADTIAGRNVNAHKANILQIAAAKTYTKPVLKGGWSPIYIQSNLIRLTAMYITVLEEQGRLSADERRILLDWGSDMIPGQKGSRGNGSSDSMLASGVAMIAWGNITNDQRLMNTGYKKFMKGYSYVTGSVGNLKRHPGHKGIPLSALGLEDEYNVALQHAIEGAAILRNLGIDVTSQRIKGHTLPEAVSWFADVIAANPSGFKSKSAWSHNYHIGWIPIYLRMFPKDPAAARLKSLARQVTSGRSPTFRAISLGGATDCLW